MALNSLFTSSILTSSQMNNLPFGIAGTVNTTPAQTVTSIVDMTGVVVLWTSPSTSRYYMTVVNLEVYNTQAATLMTIQLCDGASNVLQQQELYIANANQQTMVSFTYVETGVSGYTGRKIRFGQGFGNTGDCVTFGNQQITVIDIGST